MGVTFKSGIRLDSLGPLDETKHRPQLVALITAIQATADGRFPHKDFEGIHSDIKRAAEILSGYSRGARHPEFGKEYAADIKKIEDGAASNPLALTLQMIDQLAAQINKQHPEISGLVPIRILIDE